jgi:hypothetical protein
VHCNSILFHLSPEAFQIAVQDGWIIKDGPHKGQHCFYLPNSTIGTIPQSDLIELKNIPYVQWKTLHDSIELDI